MSIDEWESQLYQEKFFKGRRLRKTTIIEHKTVLYLSSQKNVSGWVIQYLLSSDFVMDLEESHINALMAS